MKAPRIALAASLAALVALTAHCGGSQSTAQTTVTVPAGSVSETAATPPDSASPRPSTAAPVVSSEPPPPLPAIALPEGGVCAAFAPVKSTDACAADADCAPSELCHARSCGAATKAPKKAPGTMCTMNLVCQSIDVGRCACVDKVCALMPR